MVYFFETAGPSGKYKVQLYMGKNKEENEELIKYGIDIDVWFHVDKISSAHVYLRIPTEMDYEGNIWTWDTIPQEILIDCAQLCKANSIDGNKKSEIDVIYTPWSNLHKDGSMVAGQVGFVDDRKVKRIHIAKKENAIVNRLNKTKKEQFPDLAQLQKNYIIKQERKDSELRREKEKQELELQRERRELAKKRDKAYDDLFTEEDMQGVTNQKEDDDSDDFW